VKEGFRNDLNGFLSGGLYHPVVIVTVGDFFSLGTDGEGPINSGLTFRPGRSIREEEIFFHNFCLSIFDTRKTLQKRNIKSKIYFFAYPTCVGLSYRPSDFSCFLCA
jgi:hypothetical protein